MRKFLLVVAVVALTSSAFAKPHARLKAGKLGSATVTVAKVASFPVRHPLVTTRKAVAISVTSAIDTLEASVDALGLSIQLFGSTVQAVGNGLEDSLPKPFYYIGDGLDYAGGYVAEAGAFLAR